MSEISKKLNAAVISCNASSACLSRIVERNKPSGSFVAQIGGGAVTALANIVGVPTEKLGDWFPPTDPNRQELGKIITPYLDHPEGTLAGDMARMIKGQNGAQTLMRQPVGEHALDGFKKQLQILSESEDLPQIDQQKILRETHFMLAGKFAMDFKANPNGGYLSGALLHGVGGTGETIVKESIYKVFSTPELTPKQEEAEWYKGAQSIEQVPPFQAVTNSHPALTLEKEEAELFKGVQSSEQVPPFQTDPNNNRALTPEQEGADSFQETQSIEDSSPF